MCPAVSFEPAEAASRPPTSPSDCGWPSPKAAPLGGATVAAKLLGQASEWLPNAAVAAPRPRATIRLRKPPILRRIGSETSGYDSLGSRHAFFWLPLIQRPYATLGSSATKGKE